MASSLKEPKGHVDEEEQEDKKEAITRAQPTKQRIFTGMRDGGEGTHTHTCYAHAYVSAYAYWHTQCTQSIHSL